MFRLIAIMMLLLAGGAWGQVEPVEIGGFAGRAFDPAGQRVLRMTLPDVFEYEERAPNGRLMRQAPLVLEVPVADGRGVLDQARVSIRGNGIRLLVIEEKSTMSVVDGVLSAGLSIGAQDGTVVATLDLDGAILDETHTHFPDPDPSIPGWRKDTAAPNGHRVTGTWNIEPAGSAGFVAREGEIPTRASLGWSLQPDRFSPVGAADVRGIDDGIAITAHLAPNRVAGSAGWAVRTLERPIDLSKHDAIEVVVRSRHTYAGFHWLVANATSPKPSPAPASAAIAVRSKGGPWYTARSAVPLLSGERRAIVPMSMLTRGGPGVGGGPNTTYFLDPSQIDAIAIGVANPFGVGTISFDALSMRAVRVGERGFGEPLPPARVRVFAEQIESLNGVDEVPPGLFGFHVVGQIKPEMHEYLRQTRPGLLRPLQHTGMTDKPISIEEAKQQLAERNAHRATGGPIPHEGAVAAGAEGRVLLTITNENLWARPRWMDEDVEKYAEGIRQSFRRWGARAWTPDQPNNTLRMIEFWNEPFMWGRHINRGDSTLAAGPGDPGGNRGRKAWDDPTQYDYIPALLGAQMYAKFFNAAATGLKEVNPHVQIGGMSSSAFGGDFFEHFVRNVVPWIELSREHIDFLTEHHYQGNPASFAADVEVVHAHLLARFGRAWPIINTEANDLDDVAPGDARSPEMAQAFVSMNRAYYNGREILEHIRLSRDKITGRAVHAFWQDGKLRTEGETQIYTLLSPLRGSVLRVDNLDEHVVCIATRDEAGRTIVVVHNDSPFERTIEIDGLLRGGATMDQVDIQRLSLLPDGSRTTIEPVAFDAPYRPREFRQFILPTRELAMKHVGIVQRFADLTLREVKPGESVETKLNGEPTRDASPSFALRVVTRDIQPGEAFVRIGETRIELPASSGDSGAHRVQIVPLPINTHPGETIRIESADGDGFLIYMLSIDGHVGHVEPR